MTRLLALILAAASTLLAQADGTVLERKAHTFRDFSEVKGIGFYATAEEQAAVVRDSRFRLERVVYEAGFRMVAPMLRGSEGAAGEDRLGGDELHDLMVAPALVRNLAAGDPDQLFLLGESCGGMMVFQALRDGFPAKAAAVVGAHTDQLAMLETQPEVKPLVEKL